MTDQPEPIRKSALPCTPPTEYEFSTVLTGRPDGHSGVMLLPGDIGSVVVRRTVSYGDWEPVRPTRWAAEEEPSDCSTAVAIDATYATPQPAPAPSALRDLYAAAIASYDHAVGQATNPAPGGHHYGQADAVLAVRDRGLEQLRAQVERVRAELEDVRYNLALRAFTAPDADFETIFASLDARIRDALGTDRQEQSRTCGCRPPASGICIHDVIPPTA